MCICIGEDTATIQVKADFPWNSKVSVEASGTDKKFTIALRMPGWCRDMKATGLEGAETEEKDGYLYITKVWEKGGEGAIALANKILETLEKKESHFHTLYSDDLGLKEKIETVAKEIYGADGVTYSPAAERELKRITDLGMANFPVCMAKTQYSLSDDAKKLGRPTGFKINVREVYVSAGAGFVVAVNGSIMTLPGLPKKPAAYGIDVNDDGVITGLF